MSKLLEHTMSSYYPAYCNMVDTIMAALEEARDINIHLKPLRKLVNSCKLL